VDECKPLSGGGDGGEDGGGGGGGRVTVGDLHDMAALCPGSLQLTACALVPAAGEFGDPIESSDANAFTEAGAGSGIESGETVDMLLSVTEPNNGQTARDLPLSEDHAGGGVGGGGGGGGGMVISPVATPLIWSFDHARRIIHVSMVIAPNQKQ